MRCWIFVCSLLCAAPAWAQISPPGLGEAETASWVAAGLRQDLDARGRFQSLSYVGVGAISDHDLDPLRRPAIMVLNEEVYDRFAKVFQYSLALSYRRQYLYRTHERELQQELRFYGRFSHVLRRRRFKLTSTLRPELRSFYTPAFAPRDEPLQLRFRLREQLSYSLDRSERQRLIGSAEVLSSIAKTGAGWSRFDYRESRFCLYYSLAPSGSLVVVDVGYMNDLLGQGEALTDVHYLALDVTWQNPFG